MKNNNIFDGDSYKAQFSRIIYSQLMKRNWISYADIMAEYLGYSSADQLDYGVSKCENEGELRKAFPVVCRAIRDREGEDSIEESGNKRHKRFRYLGKADDPLKDMKEAKIIDDLRLYWRFCQDSAGFFPKAWMDYYFKDSQDLLQIRSRRKRDEIVINASLDRILANIDLLPMLYEAIVSKQVLEIDYAPFGCETVTLLFHPHYLKEYNGRWYLFGHAEGQDPTFGYNLPIDRIQSRPREKNKHTYFNAPNCFYQQFFNDIIGVSHLKGVSVENIIVRAHSYYVFMLTQTKPLHHSQMVLTPFGKYENREYGEFTVQVEPNNEFIGRILQMGDGLEIISPPSVRSLLAERTRRIASLYQEER